MSHVGTTGLDAATVRTALARHFQEGTYDLLHKNCNTFSDAAVFVACGARLPDRYSRVEGLAVRNKPLLLGVMRRLTDSASLRVFQDFIDGNPRSRGFSKEQARGNIRPHDHD